MDLRYSSFLVLTLALNAQVGKQPVASLEGAVAIGVSHRPDFLGSRTGSLLPALDIQLTWRPTDFGVWQYSGLGLKWRPDEDPRGGIGIVVRWNGGRADRRASFVRPGSERLKGLGSIEATPEIGLFGIASIGGVPIHAEYRMATSSHRGGSADIGFDLGLKVTEHIGVKLSPSASWANRKTNQAIFGVSLAQASQTEYSVYQAEQGWRKVGAVLGIKFDLGQRCFVKAGVDVGRWIGQAADSPLVERHNAVATTLLIGRSF